mgnify:CR=1 FL=1|jgi:amino acid permease
MNVIISYWTLTLSPAVCIGVGLVLLAAVNLWSVRWFGEAEFWISITKVLLIIGLTLYTFITMVGGYVTLCFCPVATSTDHPATLLGIDTVFDTGRTPDHSPGSPALKT